MKKDVRSKVYDGSEVVASCRINYNLDYWNGHYNCNPEKGKHKTLTKLPDGQFAVIWSDDSRLTHFGKVIPDEIALKELIKANKYNLLNGDRFKKLKQLYKTDPDKYDKYRKIGRQKRTKPEELVIITKDGFLVSLYSNNRFIDVVHITDIQAPPKHYYRIWGVENGIQERRKLSDLLDTDR